MTENNDLTRPMAITLKCAVVNDEGNVILIKRSKNEKFNKKMWDLPGGHIEKGETFEESLKREVKEETGLNVEVGPIIRIVEFEKDHEAFAQEKRGLRFICWTKDKEVKLTNEHEEFEWLEFDKAIGKFSSKKGFELEKKETLKVAKEFLEMKKSQENWKRTLADFDNFKKRTEKSNAEFRKFCVEGFVLEILPVLDNFEMAVDHIPEENQNGGWVTGIMHIQTQLIKVLEEQGVKEIPTEAGDEVNEKIHHVISGKAKKGKGRVKKVLKKGYKIDDRVIRPANIEVK